MTGDISRLQETARWGRDWQAGDDWSAHTVSRAEADRIASGYAVLLERLGLRSDTGPKGLGIGSGAGHLEAALASRGYRMTASEWNDDGLTLIEKQNPQLERRIADLMTFHEPSAWDFIVCRELYPFTRTNDFPGQFAIISRLMESLHPGGVLLLSGSDVSRPNCLDYGRMVRELRSSGQADIVIGPVLEPLLKRLVASPLGASACRVQNAMAEAALALINSIRSPRIAGIRLFAIRRGRA